MGWRFRRRNNSNIRAMSNKIKFTEREKFLMEIYQKEIDSRNEKIRELELIISINEKHLKYKIKKIKK